MVLSMILLTAAVLAVLLTRAFMGWVEARDIAAEETHRSMHTGRVPTGGGWPLLAATIVPALTLAPSAPEYSVLLPSVLVLAIVSWADDMKATPAILRLAVHTGVAAAAVMSLPQSSLVFQGVLPFWLDRAAAGLALVWFINLFNFMDGIDGIAGTETAAIALGYMAIIVAAGALPSPLLPLAAGLGGAALGFLVWNWQPARIFMGDVGAVPLGFLTGWLMLDLASRVSLAAALILPLYFATDATLTLVRRLARGDVPWEAHRDHYYQRAARAYGSHSAVVACVALLNAALIGYAVLALRTPWLAVALAAGGVGLLVLSLRSSQPRTAVATPSDSRPAQALPRAAESVADAVRLEPQS